MRLHLFWDEKITSRIIKTFEEVFPGENEYIYWYSESSELHFAHEGNHCHIIRSHEDYPDIDYGRIDKVIIHGLDFEKIKFCIKNIPENVPVYWILWGVELYNVLLYNKGYRLYYKSKPAITLKTRLGQFLKRVGLNSRNDKMLFEFLHKRKIVMACARNEYDLFRSYYYKETITLLNEPDYFYYPIDEVLGNGLRNSYAKGNIILIGNSASWTNNHEYVFDYLRHLNLKEYKIVTPLNYGGNMDYRAKVNMLGHKYFGNSYGSLSKFLPLDEYNYLMTKAEVCIYGSWRQEAVGNIVIALYLGAKVFLSDKNPLFNELKNRGLTIFRLEDITQVLLDTPLSMDDKLRNREILLSSNSWERLKRITYEIFK